MVLRRDSSALWLLEDGVRSEEEDRARGSRSRCLRHGGVGWRNVAEQRGVERRGRARREGERRGSLAGSHVS
jgi:hypothetical protein